jgi:hypothetical protein
MTRIAEEIHGSLLISSPLDIPFQGFKSITYVAFQSGTISRN